MKYFQKQSVFDAALDRTRWLFDEFDNIVVCISGGKDSTVIYNLALMVAEEKGRLPLRVMFIDQEAEWQTVVDYIRQCMNDPRVDPAWLQIPMRISNATSANEPWLHCWEEDRQDDWMRPKEPNSIQVNKYGTQTFKDLFGAFMQVEYGGAPVCSIAGVRGEENPTRMLGLSTQAAYKWATWGKQRDRSVPCYDMYPIYDWSYMDVWKAIHDNKWPYCPIYDLMYQYGIPVQSMRVSNVHHETAVHSLFFLQEVEAETWDKLVNRIAGINTAGQLGSKLIEVPKTFPPMFSGWSEYVDYLIDNMIPDEALRPLYRKKFARFEQWFAEGYFVFKDDPTPMYKAFISTLLTNDYHFTKIANFRVANKDVDAQKERNKAMKEQQAASV